MVTRTDDTTLQLGPGRIWPPELLYLRDRFPREIWSRDATLGDLARFWLHKHAALRTLGDRLGRVSADWQEGRVTAPQFQTAFTPILGRLLGDLEGHHQVEDDHYFPIFRSVESRLARGFDVLAKDHELIHTQIATTVDAARAFLAQTGPDSDARSFAAEYYIAASTSLLASLDPHLTDEEDLVIPLLAAHERG